MNYKRLCHNRICRVLICLALICCLIAQMVPARADATAAGLAAAITGVSSVSVAAPLAVGASLIALGVMADNTNPLVFENVVNDAVESLSAAGQWVKDGAVELLRTTDEAGNAMYYAAGDMLENLRSWLFDSETLSFATVYATPIAAGTPIYLKWSKNTSAAGYYTANQPCLAYYADLGYWKYLCLLFDKAPNWLNSSGNATSGGGTSTYQIIGGKGRTLIYYDSTLPSDNPSVSHIYYGSGTDIINFSKAIFNGEVSGYTQEADTLFDLSLGQVPTYSLDGTVQDDAFRDYMSKQIRFQNQENPEDPEGDESNYNWMVPLSLGAAGTVYAMTQAEQWLGSTPSDFSDYETVTDYTIVDTPTVGGFPGILTTPNIGAGTDDDTIPVVPPAIGGGTTTIDPVEGTLSDANAQTFLDSIGSFFSSWFDSILKWLEAIWELIKAGVITLAEAIAAIPAAIAEAITDVLVWAFVPSESYLDAEVTALCSEFPLADSCKNLITAFRDSLSGLGGEPPVIYIHLEDYEGSYNIGGTVPILDMRWYARYKPTVDTLLSSLLWIFFIWRVLVHAPSIISGVAGDVEAFNSGPSGGYFSTDNPYRGQFERPARGRFESRRNRK